MKKENGKELRAKRMAEFAKEKFGLTANVSDQFDSLNPEVHPCSISFAESNEETDGMCLLKKCQTHTCSGFCLRSPSNDKE